MADFRHSGQEHSEQRNRREHEQRRPLESKPLGKWREHKRSEGKAKRSSRDVERHGVALPCTRQSVDQCGRGGMESRRAEPSRDEDDAKRDGGISQTYDWQQDHRDNRPREKKHPRPPSVGDVTETKLRHRIGHLEAHLQRPCSRKRQTQMRDEQRKQRRVDVAESVDQEMSAGKQQHRRMKAEPLPHVPARRSFRITIATP